VRLNGCDMTALGAQEREAIRTVNNYIGRPVITFVARLEPYKGCLEFIDAAIAVLQGASDCADIVVVGDGPLRAEMETRVSRAGQSARIHFVGSQPHDQIRRYLGAADIYVSTNMYGNLSNANLEALAAGLCLVLPTSDPAIPLDTVTDDLVSEDVAPRYDRTRLPESLAETLADLLASPAEVVRRRGNTAALAKLVIKPWAQSVAEDIGLLKSIAQRHAVAAAAPLRT
jgi:teichuronic acid biosynthesis glycosyltransferase TuaC